MMDEASHRWIKEYMEIFDSLPKAVREAIANSEFGWLHSPKLMAEHLANGMSTQFIIEQIKRADERLMRYMEEKR